MIASAPDLCIRFTFLHHTLKHFTLIRRCYIVVYPIQYSQNDVYILRAYVSRSLHVTGVLHGFFVDLMRKKRGFLRGAWKLSVK